MRRRGECQASGGGGLKEKGGSLDDEDDRLYKLQTLDRYLLHIKQLQQQKFSQMRKSNVFNTYNER